MELEQPIAGDVLQRMIQMVHEQKYNEYVQSENQEAFKKGALGHNSAMEPLGKIEQQM